MCSRGIAERWWLTTLLLYIPQVLYGLPLPLLAFTAWRRRDRQGGVAVAVGFLLVAGPMMGWENPRLSAAPAPGAPRVRVLAYNVELLATGPDPLVRQLQTARADVVVLVEAGRRAPRVGNLVRGMFPDGSVAEAGDITVASRWPITAETAIPLGPARLAGGRNQRRALAVTVAAPFGSFAVLGVHFHTALDGGSFRRHWRRLPAYVEGSGAVRREQAADVAAWVRRAPLPVIIAGDFNTPPAGLAYDVLRRAGLRDAFAERGWGWGYTFPARQPLLRIDYVFHTAAWDVLKCRVGAADGSDHRPVLTELTLRDPPRNDPGGAVLRSRPPVYARAREACKTNLQPGSHRSNPPGTAATPRTSPTTRRATPPPSGVRAARSTATTRTPPAPGTGTATPPRTRAQR